MDMLRKLFRKVPDVPDKTPSDVAELCKRNTADAYDRFWQDEELVNAYLEPARVDSYLFIVKYLSDKQNLGDRIVDLGFGSGDFLRYFSESMPSRFFEIYGLDYSKSAVRRARKLVPKGKFIKGDIYNLPYPSDFFDMVFCIQTLEHLTNPKKVLTEMDRICKPDGMILISVPNGEIDNYEGHVNFWDESALRGFLYPRDVFDFVAYNSNRVFMAIMRPLKV
jgi:SAM-dependent methyltransferase